MNSEQYTLIIVNCTLIINYAFSFKSSTKITLGKHSGMCVSYTRCLLITHAGCGVTSWPETIIF